MNNLTVGSICSGIEAASVAWAPFEASFSWFSEIADFPTAVLADKYPNIPNLGDMTKIPNLIRNEKIAAPDILCGGTPCQAFSLAGWKKGLEDDRGNLTLSFVDIVEANDEIRLKKNKGPGIVFWENVEGVLKDKTNAFGSFVSSLAGLNESIDMKKWPNAGLLRGPKRNVAWRVLDAKYFGLPQQRRRIYVIAGGKEFHPEKILFELQTREMKEFNKYPLMFDKNNVHYEVFREYTDCLYSAYGTKWNGNAAAYNGSLFVVQNNRIRRLSPLECERLMGFPDNYTNIENAKRTPRYQAIGNSWAVPVIKWLGNRIFNPIHRSDISLDTKTPDLKNEQFCFWTFDKLDLDYNFTEKPNTIVQSNLIDIIDEDAPEEIYISPVGCHGMIRRKSERKLRMNPRLEAVLLEISKNMTSEEIEKVSRKQKRGRFSKSEVVVSSIKSNHSQNKQLSLF
ncbi:DNA cytosine methyltransferase [Enterococcus hirae]|nr:DNA cytosine methyltransferase [Enterococcus hirae]